MAMVHRHLGYRGGQGLQKSGFEAEKCWVFGWKIKGIQKSEENPRENMVVSWDLMDIYTLAIC